MEDWTIKFALKLIRHRRETLATIGLVCVFAFVCAVCIGYVAGYHTPRPEPEQTGCVLCRYAERRYHAPVLLNLSTGEIGEMQVYDRDMNGGAAAISKTQQSGTFSLRNCAGLMMTRDTCSHTCEVHIPNDRLAMNTDYFCPACQTLLAGTEGYVLVDLYEQGNMKVYPLLEDMEHQIRDYAVSIAWCPEVEKNAVKVIGQVEGLVFID